MQENLKKYMGNSENPKGTNIINNLTSTKYFLIAMAIKKYFVSHLIHYIYFLKKVNYTDNGIKLNIFTQSRKARKGFIFLAFLVSWREIKMSKFIPCEV